MESLTDEMDIPKLRAREDYASSIAVQQHKKIQRVNNPPLFIQLRMGMVLMQ